MQPCGNEICGCVVQEKIRPVEGMIIGEAPGAREEALGVPFVGASGELLNDALFGHRERYYVTNLVKCRPPGNRNPTDEEVWNCRSNLARELYLINPRKILLLGAFPWKILSQQPIPVSKVAGLWWTGKDFPRIGGESKVLTTWHPAYILRNRSKENEWRIHVAHWHTRLQSLDA